MSEEIKEIPLKERIEKLLESGWVNEFNYLESQLQEARYLVVILQQKVEQQEKENKELKEENKRIFQNVNDDELLISNAMNYAELKKTEKKVEQLENIRKEAIKYIEKEIKDMPLNGCKQRLTNLLNILNKGSEE